MKVRPEDSLKIENIVASAKVTDYLDLPDTRIQDRGCRIQQETVPRCRSPDAGSQDRSARLWFRESRAHRCKEYRQPQQGSQYPWRQLRELGIDIPKKLDYKIQNIVTSADLATPINLNKIAVGFNLDRIEYEPEQFPGLVYRLEVPKVVVLLFGSGKLIITGGKEPDDAKKAVVKILSDLRSLGLI